MTREYGEVEGVPDLVNAFYGYLVLSGWVYYSTLLMFLSRANA